MKGNDPGERDKVTPISKYLFNIRGRDIAKFLVLKTSLILSTHLLLPTKTQECIPGTIMSKV